MLEKRSRIILAIFTVLIVCLGVRIFYLQVYSGKVLSKSASAQRTVNSEIERPRGQILDRNGIPFTDRNERIIIALKPLLLRGKDEEIGRICEILGVDFYKTKREIEFKTEPLLFDAGREVRDSLLKLNIQGLSVINSLKRYDESSVAKHLLGYLNKVDKVGGAGLEKSYEKTLQTDEEDYIGAVTDAKKNLIRGLGYRINAGGSGKELNVKLTLDYHIQKITEEAMERNKITGAVVIEDVCTGEIVAMASKPDFDQNSVENYLNSPNKELFNRAVASYNLGSIFKIIVTAVMLEANVDPDNELFCPGYIRVGDKEIKCTSYAAGGHGWVNLDQAFALSCNPYFINEGIKLGHKPLLEMGAKFGLGSPTGIKEQGVEESSGRLPDIRRYFSNGDVANISIGQGDILATPLQVADLVATVANGGIKNKINIVDSVIDSEGNKIRDLKVKKWERVIPKQISDGIRRMMEEVTVSGTGKKASLEKFGGAGGKTGSAETGQYIDGNKVVHAWFAGYFPRLNPKYSVAVFVEDGKMGGQVAAPVFEEIAEEIMKKGY